MTAKIYTNIYTRIVDKSSITIQKSYKRIMRNTSPQIAGFSVTKLERSMKRKEKDFDRDIEQFKKYLEFEKMIR